MQFNYRGVYDVTVAYAVQDVVSYQPTSSDPVKYYFCLTANTGQTPSPSADTNYWAIINALSNFPNAVDTFISHTSLQASDTTDLNRFQTLSLQSSLTPDEQTELSNLTQKLRNKLITSDDFNSLQASISNMQMYLKDSVEGYIDQKQSEFNAKVDKFSDQGVYSSATTYQATNFVTYANETYICLVDNTVGIPPTDTSKWRKVAAQGGKGDPGLTANYKGEYNSSTSYVLGDAVSYQGIFYYAKTSVSGVAPTDNTKWQLFTNIVIASSAPSAPSNNQGWLDTNTNKIKYWNGTAWVENNASNADQLGNQLPSYYAKASDLSNHLSDYAHEYSADTGAANGYVVTLNPAPNSYVTGMMVYFKATNANTGASTINVNSLGAKTIKKNISSDLASGDIKAGQVILLVYDGTNFQFASSSTPAVATSSVAGIVKIGNGITVQADGTISVSSYNPLTSPNAWIN